MKQKIEKILDEALKCYGEFYGGICWANGRNGKRELPKDEFVDIYKNKALEKITELIKNIVPEVEEEKYEHNDDEGYEYTLLRKIGKSKEYAEFRKQWTETIRDNIANNGNFAMTDSIASPLLLDVTELIKKMGYKIVKQ